MRIALGTAQFGLEYGITNTEGRVSIEMVGNILEVAEKNGVKMLDTAIGYGASESVLGKFDLSNFNVVSKIPSMSQTNKSIEQLTQESLTRLGICKLYGLMLHSEIDTDDDFYLLELKKLKARGFIEKVGASFYSPLKALKCINSGLIDIIQIPANQLDSRFEIAGVYAAAELMGVEVHVRSIFLQGLLAVEENSRPVRFQGHQDLIKFDHYASMLGLSSVELALMYISQNHKIDYAVLGCINVEQLTEIINTHKNLEGNIDFSIPNLSSSDNILINPSHW